MPNGLNENGGEFPPPPPDFSELQQPYKGLLEAIEDKIKPADGLNEPKINEFASELINSEAKILYSCFTNGVDGFAQLYIECGHSVLGAISRMIFPNDENRADELHRTMRQIAEELLTDRDFHFPEEGQSPVEVENWVFEKIIVIDGKDSDNLVGWSLARMANAQLSAQQLVEAEEESLRNKNLQELANELMQARTDLRKLQRKSSLTRGEKEKLEYLDRFTKELTNIFAAKFGHSETGLFRNAFHGLVLDKEISPEDVDSMIELSGKLVETGIMCCSLPEQMLINNRTEYLKELLYIQAERILGKYNKEPLMTKEEFIENFLRLLEGEEIEQEPPQPQGDRSLESLPGGDLRQHLEMPIEEFDRSPEALQDLAQSLRGKQEEITKLKTTEKILSDEEGKNLRQLETEVGKIHNVFQDVFGIGPSQEGLFSRVFRGVEESVIENDMEDHWRMVGFKDELVDLGIESCLNQKVGGEALIQLENVYSQVKEILERHQKNPLMSLEGFKQAFDALVTGGELKVAVPSRLLPEVSGEPGEEELPEWLQKLRVSAQTEESKEKGPRGGVEPEARAGDVSARIAEAIKNAPQGEEFLTFALSKDDFIPVATSTIMNVLKKDFGLKKDPRYEIRSVGLDEIGVHFSLAVNIGEEEQRRFVPITLDLDKNLGYVNHTINDSGLKQLEKIFLATKRNKIREALKQLHSLFADALISSVRDRQVEVGGIKSLEIGRDKALNNQYGVIVSFSLTS